MQGGMEADGLMPRTIIDAPPERVRMPQSSMPNRDNQDMEDGNTSNLRVEQQLIDVTAPALEPVQVIFCRNCVCECCLWLTLGVVLAGGWSSC